MLILNQSFIKMFKTKYMNRRRESEFDATGLYPAKETRLICDMIHICFVRKSKLEFSAWQL